jgi:osmotically-inducible protein OsmY
MKSDYQIQKDVIAELKWDPFLGASEIEAAVQNGIITLSGSVDTFSRKMSAEKVVKRVGGVKAVENNIQVDLPLGLQKTDAEITEAVRHALKWHTGVQEEKIRISVENGEVRLEGETEWDYQRNQVQIAVENLAGVISVINQIKVRPKISASDIQEKINAAFQRSATIDAGKVSVEVDGNRIILRGKVRSFTEKADAENAAWNAPGVISVESRLEIEEPEYTLEED